MMELIHQAGWASYPILITFFAGLGALVTIGRWRETRPAVLAACFAVTCVAMGALGMATGQRKVADAVSRLPPFDPRRVEYVSVGTMEASTCLLLGGGAGVLLMAAGGALVLLKRRPE